MIKDPLAVEQNKCTTKIVNTYIVYQLDAWPIVPLDNFELKICFFGGTDIVKISDKEKFVHSRYGVAFDGAGSWNCGNNFDEKIVIFGVDNSSSSHTDHDKNNILVLDERLTYGINGSFRLQCYW